MSKAAFVAVVDDDERIRDSLRILLQSAGIKARFFASAERFLLEENIGEFGCLVTDVKMLAVSGFQLHRLLVERHVSVPTIFISAFHDEEELNWAMSHGALAFLQKPFDGEELLTWVIKALGK
jgi:two-component system response regulator TtrR